MKKIILSGLLLSTLFLNSGCTDDEIAAGAIGIAIGIGLGSDNHGHHHPPHRPPPRYRECGRYGCYSANLALDFAQDQKVVSFAQRHGVSLGVASQVQQAFDAVPQEGLAAFSRVGLNEKAIQAITLRTLPSESSIESLAQHLEMSNEEATGFLRRMVADFDVQASDVTSAYWQSCMAKGKWKTRENTNCKKSSWPGCSPETGATLCY